MDQCVRGDFVEGQSASRTVQIHCYSTRGGGGGGVGDESVSVIVTDRVTNTRADQTPGLIIPLKRTFFSVSFPADSSVTH